MKTRIAVVGTGGVGGFLGGLLARFYEHSDEAEIYFVSRGQALRNIRERGLLVDAQEGRFTARPKAATDSPAEIGEMDYVLYCTKSYDVEGAVGQLLPCIGSAYRRAAVHERRGRSRADPADAACDRSVGRLRLRGGLYRLSGTHSRAYERLPLPGFGSATGRSRPAGRTRTVFERAASGPGSKRISCAAYGDKFAF